MPRYSRLAHEGGRGYRGTLMTELEQLLKALQILKAQIEISKSIADEALQKLEKIFDNQ